MPRPTRSVLISAAIFACVYVALDFNKLWALRYGADTGTFVQWLAGEAHGRGSWNGAEYRPHLQVHDSWALIALVPLVYVFPYAQTLLLLQVAAVAAAGPVLRDSMISTDDPAAIVGERKVTTAWRTEPSA